MRKLEPPSRRQPQLLINQKMQLIIDLFVLFSIKLVRKRNGVVLCILLRLIKQLFKSVWEKKKINVSKSFYMKPKNISKWNENSHNRNYMRPLWQLLKGIYYTQMTCLLIILEKYTCSQRLTDIISFISFLLTYLVISKWLWFDLTQ